MDKLLSKISAFGIPSIIFIVKMSIAKSAGLKGSAIVTSALKSIGPLGMKTGIASLGIIGLVSESFIDFGVEVTVKSVIKEILKTKDPEIVKINIDKNFWITKSLKLKIMEYIDLIKEDEKSNLIY